MKRHALMAAILMGVEEWVLEKEARQAALRAAERDESRLRALVGAEVDKARQAAEEGAPPPTGELLAELREVRRVECGGMGKGSWVYGGTGSGLWDGLQSRGGGWG